jgi:hypothetical protein
MWGMAFLRLVTKYADSLRPAYREALGVNDLSNKISSTLSWSSGVSLKGFLLCLPPKNLTDHLPEQAI